MWLEVIRAFAERTWTLLGTLLGLLTWYQSQDATVRRIAVTTAIAFAVLFLLLGGIEAYEIVKRRSVANELTDFQHSARKHYTEWWTFCQDPARSAKIETEAEEVRWKIMDILQRRLGEADAQHFNIPKAVEPFPSTTILDCPQAVKINELAHRIDRLGDIIRKLRERRS